jgi:hypothetical protein
LFGASAPLSKLLFQNRLVNKLRRLGLAVCRMKFRHSDGVNNVSTLATSSLTVIPTRAPRAPV